MGRRGSKIGFYGTKKHHLDQKIMNLMSVSVKNLTFAKFFPEMGRRERFLSSDQFFPHILTLKITFRTSILAKNLTFDQFLRVEGVGGLQA